MKKELQGLQEGPTADIYLELHRTTIKKLPSGKHFVMMAYMDSGFKNSHSYTTVWLFN